MRNEVLASLLVVAVLAGAGASYFVNEANPRTITVISTITTTLVSTTTETTVTTYTVPSGAILESATFPGRSQVMVNDIWAVLVPSRNGESNVTFFVNFENLGPSPIYFVGGFVGALSVSLAPNSTALVESPSPRCPGATFLATLPAGQNYTIGGPDCGTGFNYQVFATGLAVVHLAFGWTINRNASPPFSNMTDIQAQFKFV